MLFGHIWKIDLIKMEEEKKEFVMRVSQEFKEWVDKIIEEFDKVRGFRPSYSDVTTNIKRQFTGKFQV